MLDNIANIAIVGLIIFLFSAYCVPRAWVSPVGSYNPARNSLAHSFHVFSGICEHIYLSICIYNYAWITHPSTCGIWYLVPCHSEVSFSRQVRFAVWKEDWEGGGWIILQKMDDDGFIYIYTYILYIYILYHIYIIYIYIFPIWLYHMPPIFMLENDGESKLTMSRFGRMWAVGYDGSQVAP